MKQLMYGFDDEECTEQTFVIPCADDETLASLIRADRIADEAAAMARDDQIGAGLDALAFPDQDRPGEKTPMEISSRSARSSAGMLTP